MCNNIVCINQHVLTCYKDIKIMLIKDKPFYLQHVYFKAALNYEKLHIQTCSIYSVSIVNQISFVYFPNLLSPILNISNTCVCFFYHQ